MEWYRKVDTEHVRIKLCAQEVSLWKIRQERDTQKELKETAKSLGVSEVATGQWIKLFDSAQERINLQKDSEIKHVPPQPPLGG